MPPDFPTSLSAIEHDTALLAWLAARREIPSYRDRSGEDFARDADVIAPAQTAHMDDALELLQLAAI